MDVDFPTNLGYYAYMIEKDKEEKAMTAKKNPRPALPKPRQVVINPKPAKDNIVYTENLVPLIDLTNSGEDFLTTVAEDCEYTLQARDETGTDSIMRYGLFLGYADNGEFIPEIIVDEKGAYVLIFHDITK